MLHNRPAVAEPWILFRRPSQQARVRLFCFHHAGGNALVYRGWTTALPAWIDVCPVQLPGRGTRYMEAPYEHMADLVRDFTASVAPLLDLPVALFGHSMGAAVASAVTQVLTIPPVHLFAAGRLPPTRPHPKKLHLLDDPGLLAYLRRLGGTPEIVFSEPELLRQVLPLLRADLRLNDPFCTRERLRAAALTVIGGEADPEVPPEALAGWGEVAPPRYQLIVLPGGHFFTATAADEVRRVVVDGLAEFA